MSDILSQEEVDGLLNAVFDNGASDTAYSISLWGGGFDFSGRGSMKVISATFMAWARAVAHISDRKGKA